MVKIKIQTITTPKGERYLLLDDNYKVIIEVKNYLKYLDNLNKSPNTLKNYAYHLKIFYTFLDKKSLKVEDVLKIEKPYMGTLNTLSEFISWLQYPDMSDGIIHIQGETAKRSNKTINLIMNTVLGFYDYMAKNGDLKSLDVYKELKQNSQFKSFLYEMTSKKKTTNKSLLKLKEKKNKIKYITREQYNELFKSLNTNRDKIMAGLMFECGLRISEVLGLHITDLELWDNKVNIIARDNNENGARVKNCSEGTVLMPDYLVEVIQEYLINDLVDYDTDYMFINFYGENKGKPMMATTVEKLYERITKKLGYKIHPHMLRHGYATEKIQAGWSLLDIKEELRHRQIQTTSKYVSLTDEYKMEKARTFFDEIGLAFTPKNKEDK